VWLGVGLGAIAGFVVGFGAATRLSPGETAPPLAGEPPTSPGVPGRAPPAESTSGPSATVDELRRQLAVQTALNAAWETELYGSPIPWPADLPEKYTAAGYEAHVRAIVADCNPATTLTGFECGEPPCYALLRPPATGSDFESALSACSGWRELYGGSVTLATETVDCGDGRTEGIQILAPRWDGFDDPDDPGDGFATNASKRFQARVAEIKASWVCAP
jgi:hypothetical protein